MTEHTPGPWRACHGGECRCGQVFGENGNTLVARAAGEFELENFDADQVPIKEVQSANTRLIAAAPDILAALKGLLAADRGGVYGTPKLIAAAWAAIDKAERRAAMPPHKGRSE